MVQVTVRVDNDARTYYPDAASEFVTHTLRLIRKPEVAHSCRNYQGFRPISASERAVAWSSLCEVELRIQRIMRTCNPRNGTTGELMNRW